MLSKIEQAVVDKCIYISTWWFCLPFEFNPTTSELRVVQAKWKYALAITHFIFTVLYVIFLIVRLVPGWGYSPNVFHTKSYVIPIFHVFFLAIYGWHLGFQIGAFIYSYETVYLYNQIINLNRTFGAKYFNKQHIAGGGTRERLFFIFGSWCIGIALSLSTGFWFKPNYPYYLYSALPEDWKHTTTFCLFLVLETWESFLAPIFYLYACFFAMMYIISTNFWLTQACDEWLLNPGRKELVGTLDPTTTAVEAMPVVSMELGELATKGQAWKIAAGVLVKDRRCNSIIVSNACLAASPTLVTTTKLEQFVHVQQFQTTDLSEIVPEGIIRVVQPTAVQPKTDQLLLLTVGSTLDESVHMYRTLVLLNTLFNCTLGSLALPALKTGVEVCLVISLYGMIRAFGSVNFAMYVFLPALALMLVVQQGGIMTFMAEVFDISRRIKNNSYKFTRTSAFLFRTLNPELAKYQIQRMSSLRPLRCKMGCVYFVENSTRIELAGMIINLVCGLLIAY